MSNKSQPLIGAHTSTAGGLPNALLEGKEIEASIVQIFTSNQKQWKGRVLTPEIVENWKRTLEETGLSHIMSHDSYLINLGGPRADILEKSRLAFSEELKRCVALGIPYLNFHPGAALDGGEQECLDRIVQSLLLLEPILDGSKTRLLLETTAGQGSCVGYSFEHLAYIIGKVKGTVPIGVCIDTCHIFVAGYDLRTSEACNQTISEFDRVIGLQYLFALHLNDSQKGLGSRVDRHQPLGDGEIGWDAFRFVMTDPRLCHLPKYLETPGGPPRWKEEIKQLKKFWEIRSCA